MYELMDARELIIAMYSRKYEETNEGIYNKMDVTLTNNERDCNISMEAYKQLTEIRTNTRLTRILSKKPNTYHPIPQHCLLLKAVFGELSENNQVTYLTSDMKILIPAPHDMTYKSRNVSADITMGWIQGKWSPHMND